MNSPELKITSRDAFCRVCDAVIKRNKDKMVSWYSFRNTGQHIHICVSCVKKLGELVADE